MKPKYKNYPLMECVKAVKRILSTYPPGTAIYQKWTCGKCGERVTGDTPNMLTEFGTHSERIDGKPCGHTTDIGKSGCNYNVVTAIGGIASVPPKGRA